MKKYKRITIILLAALFLFSSCGDHVNQDDDPDRSKDLKIQQDIINENNQTYDEILEILRDEEPSFQDALVYMNPYKVSPLSALVAFQTDDDVSVRVEVTGDTTGDTVVYELSSGKEHLVPILGLYPDRVNRVTLSLMKDGIALDERILSLKTDPLPEALKNMVTITKADATPYPGLTLVSGGFLRNPYMFDSSGVIRWYLTVESDAHGYFPSSSDRFFLIAGYSMIQTETREYARFIFEMDYLGRLHKVYDIPGGVHHEVVEKEPGGNLLILGNSLDGHVEDTIAEIDRDTGKIVKEINLALYITNTKYNDRYDWAHINSLSYNREEGTMILSPRDVSSVMKIDWDKEEILWILSDPEIWKGTPYESYVLNPLGDSFWHYEQHAAFDMSEDLDGNPSTLDLMLFDNRTIRNELNTVPIKGDEGRSSVTQYAIDETAKTVTQVRRFPNSHAIITSNFEIYLEENRLIANHGSVRPTPDSPLTDMYGEIFEYEFSTGQLLHQYSLKSGFYRAHRVNFIDLLKTSKSN